MRKHNFPTIIVLLGATGDLVARKILPSLLELHKHDLLPDQIQIVGFSRREWDDTQFRDYLKTTFTAHHRPPPPNHFLERFSFSGGNFDDMESFKTLYKHLQTIDTKWGMCTNKLFYLAVPPKYYKTIFNYLDESGLTVPCWEEEVTIPQGGLDHRSLGKGGWTRVIVEKPFGKDLKTAQELDALLAKLFEEKQIYRIDHYLAKEILQNIIAFRFSNNLLEDGWNKNGVEKVEVRLLEKIGIEKRGEFYDGIGALRDVGQNHLLQMLTLATMDQPDELKDTTIRTKRANVLKTLQSFSARDIKEKTIRAQYQGFTDEDGVAKNSTTETYFRIETELKSNRWQGIPIILEGGKSMAYDQKEVIVTFKHPMPCLCPPNQHFQNKVRFTFTPQDQIEVSFWGKKPGFVYELEEQILSLDISDNHNHQKADEYSRLLLDCIAGDQTLFVSTVEVESMWKFIDPIVKSWNQGVIPLLKYEPGGEIHA